MVNKFIFCVTLQEVGIASVLNEVAEFTQLGYHINQKLIPLDEQVEGACEMPGPDPLYVANEGYL